MGGSDAGEVGVEPTGYRPRRRGRLLVCSRASGAEAADGSTSTTSLSPLFGQASRRAGGDKGTRRAAAAVAPATAS
jgi:hypothetical protein